LDFFVQLYKLLLLLLCSLVNCFADQTTHRHLLYLARVTAYLKLQYQVLPGKRCSITVLMCHW